MKRIGQAFGSCYNKETIAVGRDTRVSGPSLESAFIDGVVSVGCNVENYGVIPIPLISFITLIDHLSAAAYISASHNPPEYNGVRFRKSEGYGMLYRRDTNFMTYYDQEAFSAGLGFEKKCDPKHAISRYTNYVNKKIKLNNSLKIVLDMGNGSACTMGKLYKDLGYDPVIINGNEDGMFRGRGSAPTEESLQKAAKCVVSSKADYGVGFDADADRGLIIDDKGRIVQPEKIAIILARRRYSPGDLVIAGFDCSMILEQELKLDGIRVERERVGDVFIANRVKESKAVVGVERSAHFFLPEFQYSDDPFAMSFALGEIISEGEKLSVLSDQIPEYPYKQIRIHLNEDPSGVMLRLEDVLAKENPDKTDGLKIITDSYSVLIRPSNTEPILRLYIETKGNDMNELEIEYEQKIHEAMKV
jgi:phosphomannomutase